MNSSSQSYRKIYLFDVLNANEILKGEKPQLKERGPYTYRAVVEKKNVKHLNKSKISYNLLRSYYFEANLSVGNENDTITFMNIPAMVSRTWFIFININKELVSLIKVMIDSLASNDHNTYMINISKNIIKRHKVEIFMNKTVKELVSGKTKGK